MDRLLIALLVELIDLEVGNRDDSRQFAYRVEECTKIGEITVHLDLDRLGHDRILLCVITRCETHHDHSTAVRSILQAL